MVERHHHDLAMSHVINIIYAKYVNNMVNPIQKLLTKPTQIKYKFNTTKFYKFISMFINDVYNKRVNQIVDTVLCFRLNLKQVQISDSGNQSL